MLSIRHIAILLLFLTLRLTAQEVNFVLEPPGPAVGETVTITNHSDPLEDGTFVFLFQHCSFVQTNLPVPALVCRVETSDPDAEIEGFFWQAGSFSVLLIAINQAGDTLASKDSILVEVSDDYLIPPLDSCPDTAGFNCDNLVCNGSFEWIAASLTNLGQLPRAYPWRDVHSESTCDLFNPDNAGQFGYLVDVPDNFLGTQQAQHGSGYCGMGGFLDLSSSSFEIATTQLKSPLKMGQRYAVEYYTSMADTLAYSCNGAKVYFSSNQPSFPTWQAFVNQLDHVNLLDALGNVVISDKQKWTHFYDVFIPGTNSLEWISIGLMREWNDITLGFDPNVNSPFVDLSFYYYYDNISVTPLPPLVYLEQDTVWIYRCDTAHLLVLGEGAGSYSWSNNATTAGITVSPMTDATYSVTVTDPENCHNVVLQAHVIIKDPYLEPPVIVGHNNDCDTITSYNLENRQAPYNYIWEISSNHGVFTANNTQSYYQANTLPVEVEWTSVPALPLYATLSVTEVTACDETGRTVTFKVFKCCERGEEVTYLNNDTISDTIFLSSQAPFMINGELVINAQQLVAFDFSPMKSILMGPMASIKVMSPHTELRLDSCMINIGCDYMWDGIYLNDSTQLLSANQSQFYHGINAINAINGARLEIENCKFDLNYQAIVYSYFPESDRPVIPATGKYWPVDIVGTEFSSNGTQPLIFPPRSSSISRSAIEIIDADTIIIGKPGAAPNYFHDLSQAIIVKNSNTGIFNNEFENTGLLDAYPPAGAVDIFKSGQLIIPTLDTRVGNGLTSGKNIFINCQHAITAYDNPVVISKNEFSDCNLAIHCLNLRQTTIINHNLMTQTAQGSLSGDRAITLANAVPNPRSLNILVDSNDIQGYYKGIWATNLAKQGSGIIRVLGNTIHFNALGTGISGIKADNCDGILIRENLISSVTRPDYTMGIGAHNGIWSNHTQGALISHNHLLRMGNGIYTTGPGLNTYFVCNALDSCYYGFYFGESTSLSHQGVLDVYNTANHWFGDYTSNGCSYWRRMMQAIGNISNPVINWYYPITYSVYDPGTNHCGQNHPLYLFLIEIENNNAQTDCQIFSPAFDVFNISTDKERELLLGAMARGEIQYDTLQVPYREKEGDFFYRIANHDPRVLSFGDTTDVAFQQYYHLLSQGKTGIKESVYQFIHEAEYLQAYYLNESLPDTSRRDVMRKRVNRIYLETWCQQVFTFSSADRDSLIVYAYGNPHALGDAVFSARVLLGLDPDKVPLTQRGVAEDQQSSTAHILFYPNPGKDKTCFVWGAEHIEPGTRLRFELYDSHGKRLVDKTITGKLGEICEPLPANIAPGLYIVRLSDNLGKQASGKIIVR